MNGSKIREGLWSARQDLQRALEILERFPGPYVPAESAIEARSSPENLHRCTRKEDSSATTPLSTALNEPWQYGSVESTCKTASESLACWSAKAAFSQDILLFLLLIKTYGLEKAIFYAVKTDLCLTAEFEASIAEFCKREKIDFSE